MSNRDQAKSLLLHYFKLAAAGNQKALETSDCVAEIEGIVDDIVDAAVEEIVRDRQRWRTAREDRQ